eukprot:g185.t1
MNSFSGSYVDESLFGPTKKSKKLRAAGRNAMGGRDSNKGAIYLQRSELERMKRDAIVITPALARQMKAEKKRLLEASMKEAFDRKNEMIRKEEIRKRNLPPDEAQVEKNIADKKIRDRAQMLRNEEEDDIKGMGKMMAYAMTVGVRDAQVREKIDRKAREKLVEKREQIRVELERLRTVKFYKDRDHKRRNDERKASLQINVQIEEAKQRRKKALEEKRKEQERLKARAKFLDEQEAERERRRKAHGKKLLDEMTKANEEMRKWKKIRKQKEIEEDRKIEEWIKKKAAFDAAEDERKAKIAAEKERQAAKMRAEQKRMNDGREALDELRARRAFEKKDREMREKELKEARERKAAIDRIQAERKVQALAAARRRRQIVKDQRETFYRNYETQAEQMRIFQENEQKKHHARIQNRDDILLQVQEKEKQRKLAQKEYIREGHESVARRERELERVRQIQQSKIDLLRSKGVPDKFMSEMINYDAQKVMMNDYKRGGKW